MNLPRGSGEARLRWKSLALLLVAAAAIQLITLPRFRYPGDNLAVRAETIGLVQDRRFGLPREVTASPEFGEYVRRRGQYFYENDAKHRLYSKYGFGYTLLYVPPVMIEEAINGAVEPMIESDSLLLIINLYNVAFAVGILFYLYRLASLYTKREWLRIGFALLVVYPSYVWHYLRAPTLEIYQLFFFVAFCAHLLAYLRGAQGANGRTASLDLLGASCAAGFLLLLRPTFGALIPFVLIAAAAPTGLSWASVRENLRLRPLGVHLAAGIPLLILISIWLTVNAVRTGSPFDAGYAQWLGPDGLPVARFTVSAVPAALRGFLLQPGNYNVFLHQPLLVFALLGWPAFLRSNRGEAVAVLAIALACITPILAVSNWQGEWNYGPRYLVHPLVILCLPAVFAAEKVLALKPRVRWPAFGGLAGVLALSLALQVQMNSLHYFAFQFSHGWFKSRAASTSAERWFEEPRLRSLYAWQLKRFVEHDRPLAPVEMTLEQVPGPERAHAREQMQRTFRDLIEPNWYFARANMAPVSVTQPPE